MNLRCLTIPFDLRIGMCGINTSERGTREFRRWSVDHPASFTRHGHGDLVGVAIGSAPFIGISVLSRMGVI